MIAYRCAYMREEDRRLEDIQETERVRRSNHSIVTSCKLCVPVNTISYLWAARILAVTFRFEDMLKQGP